jgi:prolyl 4-hydroxylase
MQSSQLSDVWRAWLMERLQHGCKPSAVLRELSARGGLSAQVALAALAEAQRTACNSQGADVSDVAGRGAANLTCLKARRPMLSLAGHGAQLRAVMSQPPVVVLDHVLAPDDCAALFALAQAPSSDGTDVQRGAVMPRLEAARLRAALAQRLGALVQWPTSHLEPASFSRFVPDGDDFPRAVGLESAHALSDHPGDAAGHRVALFIVVLAAPDVGGAIALSHAGGLRVMPVTGSALWIERPLRADGRPDRTALAVVDPVLAGCACLATVWLRDRACSEASCA